MIPVIGRIESMTLSEALVYSLIGFAIVFVVLIVLMIVIRVLRMTMEKFEGYKAVEPDSDDTLCSVTQDANLVPAKGSVGEICLFTVDDKTAAMLMAIVADESKVPLNELRFLYVREECQCVSEKGPAAKMLNTMRFSLKINGKRYEVGAERCERIMVAANEIITAQVSTTPVTAAPVVAPSRSAAGIIGEPVKSPLPGVVLAINATEGEFVKAGQVLLLVEAMKMENEIVAPRDGRVTQITVSKGSSVETDTILLTLI